jgi:citrate lyase beta subunit
MSDIQGATARDLSHARSLLFSPGGDERKLANALASEADLVVADLEDAVAPAGKPAAREVVARLAPPVVRINGVDTEWFEDDVVLVRELELAAVVLPKATPDAVAALGADGPPVIAIVETALGVRLAYETASTPRVAALAIGAVDLGVQLRLEPRPDGLEILHTRSRVVVDSAAAGIRAPFDVVHVDIRDDEGLAAQAAFARSLGFRGKSCIHPGQVPIVNRVFMPSDREVAWARDVVAAFEESAGQAVAVNGEMIDLPAAERARRVLDEVERSSG